jgi:hypothetical protein
MTICPLSSLTYVSSDFIVYILQLGLFMSSPSHSTTATISASPLLVSSAPQFTYRHSNFPVAPSSSPWGVTGMLSQWILPAVSVILLCKRQWCIKPLPSHPLCVATAPSFPLGMVPSSGPPWHQHHFHLLCGEECQQYGLYWGHLQFSAFSKGKFLQSPTSSFLVFHNSRLSLQDMISFPFNCLKPIQVASQFVIALNNLSLHSFSSLSWIHLHTIALYTSLLLKVLTRNLSNPIRIYLMGHQLRRWFPSR